MTDSIVPAEAASNRADALEEVGDIEGAIQAMTEAVELAPEKLIYRALRGRLYSVQKNWRAAIRDFDDVLAVKPNASSALYTRGRARFMSDDFDGAIADLERCIALEPDAADAWSVLGNVHRYRRDWKSAIRAYERVRQLEPDKRAELEEVILEMKEQLWLGENGPSEPLPRPRRKYTSPRHDPEYIRRRDELAELFQKRREHIVPHHRKRLRPEDSES